MAVPSWSLPSNESWGDRAHTHAHTHTHNCRLTQPIKNKTWCDEEGLGMGTFLKWVIA